jgi:hypothetical protein
LSCLVLSCLVLSCLVLSCLVLSCLVLVYVEPFRFSSGHDIIYDVSLCKYLQSCLVLRVLKRRGCWARPREGRSEPWEDRHCAVEAINISTKININTPLTIHGQAKMNVYYVVYLSSVNEPGPFTTEYYFIVHAYVQILVCITTCTIILLLLDLFIMCTF